jgi:acyl carrier protein
MQLNQIIDIIADHAVLDARYLNADSELATHLDSLDIFEIASIIEHRSGVDISDADVEKCKTIGDLHKLVSQDDDLDEPLPPRTASCDGDTCESCQ